MREIVVSVGVIANVGLGVKVADGVDGEFEGDGVVAFFAAWLHPSRVSSRAKANKLVNFRFIFCLLRDIPTRSLPVWEIPCLHYSILRRSAPKSLFGMPF